MVQGPNQTSTRKFQSPKNTAREIHVGDLEEMLAIKEPLRPSLQPLLISLLVFAVIDIIWIMFFSLHPDEGKTVFQALYMSVITLTSVGFGWFTPVTEEGMIFAAQFMRFCLLQAACVKPEQLDCIEEAFERMKSKDG